MFLLIINSNEDKYIITGQAVHVIEEMVGITETSINELFDGNAGSLIDNNDRPCFVANDLEHLRERLRAEILSREAFFDDLADPANPVDAELYTIIGTELGLLQKAVNEI